jgi:hypothetical protein
MQFPKLNFDGMRIFQGRGEGFLGLEGRSDEL